MARFRRKARRMGFRAVRRSRRSGSSSGTSLMGSILPAALYGAARPYVANLVQPVTGALGAAGVYADNLVLGGLGYLAAKKGSGMIRSAGHAMLIIEAANAAAHASSGMAGNTGGGF